MSQFQDVTISRCHNFKVSQFQNVTITKIHNYNRSQFQDATITKKNLSHKACHIFMGIKDILDRNWIVVQCVDVCVLLDLLDAIRH